MISGNKIRKKLLSSRRDQIFLQTRKMSGKDEGQKDLKVIYSDKENVLVVDSIWGMRFDNTNTTVVSGQGDCANGGTVYRGNKYRGTTLREVLGLFGETLSSWNLPCSSDGKESACNAGDLGWIPGQGRSSGEGNGNPLKYSCLENPMDRGAWGTMVYRVAESQTRLQQLSTAHRCIYNQWYN